MAFYLALKEVWRNKGRWRLYDSAASHKLIPGALGDGSPFHPPG